MLAHRGRRGQTDAGTSRMVRLPRARTRSAEQVPASPWIRVTGRRADPDAFTAQNAGLDSSFMTGRDASPAIGWTPEAARGMPASITITITFSLNGPHAQTCCDLMPELQPGLSFQVRSRGRSRGSWPAGKQNRPPGPRLSDSESLVSARVARLGRGHCGAAQ